jgi:hypothetical protein
MTDIIIQYVLIVLLIVGLSYFVYLIKDKGITIKEDYFGITYTILRDLIDAEATSESIKKILRAVSEAVIFVEINYKNEPNAIKEEKAMVLSKETVGALDFESTINEESIRYIIRLSAALMPGKNSSSIGE